MTLMSAIILIAGTASGTNPNLPRARALELYTGATGPWGLGGRYEKCLSFDQRIHNRRLDRRLAAARQKLASLYGDDAVMRAEAIYMPGPAARPVKCKSAAWHESVLKDYEEAVQELEDALAAEAGGKDMRENP